MNFLDVTEGLEQGKAYRHKDWREVEYICMNSFGSIEECDGHTIRPIRLKTKHILSTDWEECPKKTWYLFDMVNAYNESLDNESLENEFYHKQIICRLSNIPNGYYPYNYLQLNLFDLKEHAHFLNIEIIEKQFSENELQKLKDFFVKNKQK